MRKFAVLLALAAVLLIIDGTMTYDLLDFKNKGLKFWLAAGLSVIIFIVLAFAEASKPSDKQDNQK